MTENKCYGLLVELYDYEMGETLCDCCGPELETVLKETTIYAIYTDRKEADEDSRTFNYDESPYDDYCDLVIAKVVAV